MTRPVHPFNQPLTPGGGPVGTASVVPVRMSLGNHVFHVGNTTARGAWMRYMALHNREEFERIGTCRMTDAEREYWNKLKDEPMCSRCGGKRWCM